MVDIINIYNSIGKSNDKVSKSKLASMIEKLDKDGQLKVAKIIKLYHIQHSDTTNIFELPYKGKVVKNHIEFDIVNFPEDLRYKLFTFCNLHLSRDSSI